MRKMFKRKKIINTTLYSVLFLALTGICVIVIRLPLDIVPHGHNAMNVLITIGLVALTAILILIIVTLCETFEKYKKGEIYRITTALDSHKNAIKVLETELKRWE